MVITAQSQARVSIADVRFEDVDPTEDLVRPPSAPRCGTAQSRSHGRRAPAAVVGRRAARPQLLRGARHARVTFGDDGAHVAVNLVRGLARGRGVRGRPLPDSERERLVPVRTEASVDEDLLEDSSLQIENYFKAARIPRRQRGATRATSATAG